jgi:hypothetical protein
MKKKVTFNTFYQFELSDLASKYIRDEPIIRNFDFLFRKYKIIIEPIEEDISVLEERIQKAYDENSKSQHIRRLLHTAAKEINYKIKEN